MTAISNRPEHVVTWMARRLIEEGFFDDLYQDIERDWERLFSKPALAPLPLPLPPKAYDPELEAAVQRMNSSSKT